ncbi:MAG: site-specific DNA-methyltransferase, partial [Jaaginema sp. PMC 1079.18]|nr:site-specific DNA-methyltransferase [Jaaginema sp. PMC 1079.18]
PTIPHHSVDLIITSSPYNIGKEYEVKVSIEDYLKHQSQIIAQLYHILKPTGSICWQVGNFVKKGEVYPLDIFYYNLFKQFNLHLRNRIIWRFGHGLHASKRFSGRYETILWFTKSDNYKFNLDAVRVPSKYPGKRHYKGKNKGKPSGNPRGKNPSDFWEIVVQNWDEEVWDIPNVKSNHPEKTIHPCQYPIELVERCILALTDENDVVFDPYTGVGSAIIAALKHNRRAMGCEKEEKYIEIATERISSYFDGTLKMRPLGKPVHQPSGREKVSQRPQEWQQAEQLKLFENSNKYKT